MGSTKVAKKEDKKNFVKLYEESLPSLMSKNLALQDKALAVIEEKIEESTAYQAAQIYKILNDRAVVAVGQKSGDEKNTFNMYFGDGTMNSADMASLMGRVMTRMNNKDKEDSAIDVDSQEDSDDEDN